MAYLQNTIILASIVIAGCYLWEIAWLLYARSHWTRPNRLRAAIAAANRGSLVTHDSLETMNGLAQLRSDGLIHKQKLTLPPYTASKPLQGLIAGLESVQHRLLEAATLISILESPETCSTSSYEFVLSPLPPQQKVPDTPSPGRLEGPEQKKADCTEFLLVLLHLRSAMRSCEPSQLNGLHHAVRKLCLEDTLPRLLLLCELQRPILDFWADALYFLADKLQPAVYLAVLHVLLRPSDLVLRALDAGQREYVLSIALNQINHFPQCIPIVILWFQCSLHDRCLHYALLILCLNSKLGGQIHEQCSDLFTHYFNQEPNGDHFALAVALSRYLRLIPLG